MVQATPGVMVCGALAMSWSAVVLTLFPLSIMAAKYRCVDPAVYEDTTNCKRLVVMGTIKFEAATSFRAWL